MGVTRLENAGLSIWSMVLILTALKNSLYNNPLSLGFDLETGGHVFQLHFTNSQFMNANGVMGNSTGDWSEGDFYFGFNISRSF